MPDYGRLIEWDPDALTAVYHKYDHSTRESTITEVQNHQPFIESNRRFQSMDTLGGGTLSEASKRMIKENWWWVAKIPNSVIAQWRTVHGVNLFNKDHWPKVRRLLNDPDYRYLRTGLGRL